MDYDHARHAGNGGDVIKHVALIALLEAMVRDPAPLTYVETHAGAGLYPLGSAGEWGDGVLRVWNAREGLLGRYAEIVRGFSAPGAARPASMPGSPLVARALLRDGDRMVLHEIDSGTAGVLRRALPRADVRERDGLSGVEEFRAVPRQRADHRGAAGQPARPRAELVPRQRADSPGAAGQPARPRAELVVKSARGLIAGLVSAPGWRSGSRPW